jgi:hypothetical protein
MTPSEVIAVVGEPSRSFELGDDANPAEKWAYDSDSLYLSFTKGLVSMVEAGFGVPFDGSPRNEFGGRTQEGLGIGSTRDEVLVGLGTPHSTHNDPRDSNAEFVSYRELGIEVTLWKRRVVGMLIHRRPAPSQRERTRSSPSALRSPLTRHPLGRGEARRG